MVAREGKDAALAQAYAELLAAGEVPTVRALRERARVGTDAAAAWLKATRPAEVPPMPEGFAAAAWPLVYGAARDVALADVARELAEAREGEVEALAQAERDDAVARAAVERAERADEHADQLGRQATEAEAQAERERLARMEAQAEVARLTSDLADAEARAVRAEAQADTLRGLVEDLRGDLRSIKQTRA